MLFEKLLRCRNWNSAVFLGPLSYGIILSHIFKMRSISNEKPSISIKIISVSIENFGFRWKYLEFSTRNLKILSFSHLEFEILSISSEIPNISKTWSFK